MQDKYKHYLRSGPFYVNFFQAYLISLHGYFSDRNPYRTKKENYV